MLFNNQDFDFSFFEIPGNDFKLEIEMTNGTEITIKDKKD